MNSLAGPLNTGPMNTGPMNIGEAARLSGLPAKTIRYYESINLVGAASRSPSGYRRYGPDELSTLKFIQRARGLGFSVEDVRGLLALWRDKGRSSAEVKKVALRHATAIDRKIEELTSLRQTLEHLIERCHGDDMPDCPILDDLAG